MLHQPINIKDYIWQCMNDLPKDCLHEILYYVIYNRKQAYEPELFQLDNISVNEDLIAKSHHEVQHLEEEFIDYKTKFPYE